MKNFEFWWVFFPSGVQEGKRPVSGHSGFCQFSVLLEQTWYPTQRTSFFKAFFYKAMKYSNRMPCKWARIPFPLQNMQIPLAHLCSILRSFDHDEKGRLTKIVLRYRLQSMCRCLTKVIGFYYKCLIILSAALIWKFERREIYEENMYRRSTEIVPRGGPPL